MKNAKIKEKVKEKSTEFFPLGIQVGSQKYERISHVQPGLAKLSCGWSTFWLYHKLMQ